MKRIPRWLKSIFSPNDLQNLDVHEILDALNDSSVRKEWILETFEELKRINLEVDRKLLSDEGNIIGLAARRKAYQDMLESILTARRREKNPNPRSKGEFDLDSVTVHPA